MSKQIDERIVSMQFDNRQFEANVKTSMSTLEKLKNALSLKGSAKAAQSEFASYKAGMFSFTDSINKMWANLEQNVANRMERLLKSFTLDPLKTGFDEYETKINAVQTIMSNTASKGTTMADITKVLDELNTYADKTIYNFAEMTRNIGTFTAAGVGLEDSAAAIQGIANLAAASGSTSQQASTAMYQLSQALSTGTVRLMDWNSVVNAGMGGEKFQEALKATAREHGVAVDDMIKKAGSFRESLSDEWLTADILNETLRKFTVDGAAKYADAMVKSGKYTKEQAEALKLEAQNMEDAATKVKTFTQLMDTLKESVQSGWAKTWELLFGNFEQAREFFSGIYERLGGVIDRMSDARNTIIEGGLADPWDRFNNKIQEAGVSTEDFQKKLSEVAKENGYAVDDLVKKHGSLAKAIAKGEIPTKIVTETLKRLAGVGGDASKSTENMTEKLEKFQKVVNEVWHGDYGNGEARVKALTEAGYDYAKVQDLVNKTVDGHKLTLDDLSDAQLKSVGYTEEQIATLRKLASEAENSGTPLNELIASLDKPSGRELLISSLMNALDGLGSVLGSVGKAWKEIFSPGTAEEKAAGLYGFLEALHEFSEKLVVSEEAADKFKRTFKGVFAILDIVLTLIAGPFKIAFKLIAAILEECDLNILDVTASIGDAIVAFRDWVDRTLDFKKAAKWLVDPIKNSIKAFKDWIAVLKESDNIPRDIAKGLVNGLVGAIKFVAEAAKALATKIIEVVKDVLGIHSPSVVMMALGGFAALGLIIGFKDKLAEMFPEAATGIENFIYKTKELFGNVDWGLLFIGGMSAGTLGVVNKIANALGILASPFEGLADTLEGVGQAVKNFGKGIKKIFNGVGRVLNAFAFKTASKGLINLAIAIGILVAAIVVLTMLPTGKMWSAVGAVVALTAVLGTILILMTKLSTSLDSFDTTAGAVKSAGSAAAKAGFVLSLGVFILAIAGAVMMLGKMNTGELVRGSIALGVITGAIVGLMAATKLLTKAKMFGSGDKIVSNMGEFGKMFQRLAISLLIIAAAVKIFGSMNPGEMIQGGIAVGAILLAVIGLMAATKLLTKAPMHSTKKGNKMTSNMREFGKMLQRIAVSLLIIAAAVKIFGNMSRAELNQGSMVVAGILLAVVGLMAATKLLTNVRGPGYKKAETSIRDFGKMMLNMSVSLLLIAATMKIFAAMPIGEIIKGGSVVAIILGAMIGVMAATRLLAKDEVQAGAIKNTGKMMLSISAGLLIAGLAMKLIGTMDTSEILKGGTAIAILIGAMVGIMAATKLLSKDATSLGALKQVGIMMLMISGAILVLTGAMYVLTKIDPDRYTTALSSVIVMMGAFAGLMFVTKFIRPSGMKTLIVVLAGIALLIGAIIGLSFIDPERLRGTAMAIAAVLATFGVVLAGMGILSKFSRGLGWMDILKTFVMFSALLLPIAGIIGLMSKMPKAYDATDDAVAVSLLLLAMTGVITAMSMFKTDVKNVLKGVVGLLALSAVIAAVAGVMVLLNKVDSAGVLDKVAGLSAMLLAMSGVLAIVSLIGKLNFKAIATGVIGLGLMAGVMALVVLVLAQMDAMHVEPSVKTSMSMAVLLLAMAGVLAIVSAIGLMPPHSILLGIAGLALMVVVLELLVLALATMKALDINPSIEQCSALCILLIGMSAALAILGGVGVLGPAAFIGIGALAALIGALTVIVAAAGGLMKIPGISEFMAGGITFLEQLLGGLGSIIGSFIGGIGAGISDGLRTIADNIDYFITTLNKEGGFFPTIRSLDESVLKGVAVLTGAILLLTAAEFINGIASFVPGSMVTLGYELSGFAYAIQPFIEQMKTVDPAAMQGVKYLAEAVLILTAAEMLDGIMRFFSGGKGAFQHLQETLPGLGTAFGAFRDNLGEFGPEEAVKAESAAKAVKYLAEAADAIPNSGGWLGKIVGENDLGTFAEQMSTLGVSLAGLMTNLRSGDGLDVELVQNAAKCITALAEASNKIPNEGGWWAKITGDNSIAEFGSNLPAVGRGLAGFVTGLKGAGEGGFTEDSLNIVKVAAQALTALADAASKMPTDGGWWGKIVGDPVTLEEFSSQFPKVAKALKGFVTELGTFSEGQCGTIEAGVKAINSFAGLADIDLGSLTKNLPKFGENITGFAGNLKSFTSEMSRVDPSIISAASDNMGKILGLLGKFEEVNFEKIKSFKDALKSCANAGVTTFTNTFKNSFGDVKIVGQQMFDQFISGVASKSTDLDNAATTMSKTAIGPLNNEKYISSWNQAGVACVNGFASGITAQTFAAEAAAQVMAEAAYIAAKNQLDVNSPSKVFRSLGTSVPEGFAQGIDKLGGVVAASSEAMGDTAIDGVRNSLSNLGRAVTSDIDTQPVIRPVLDLSEVRTGIHAIDGMFGTGASVGVMANVRSVGYSMDRRNQNGGNGDVVKAIGQLHDDIGNISQPSYTIGNITLSGDDEVAAAFETIIRAARIERRT